MQAIRQILTMKPSELVLPLVIFGVTLAAGLAVRSLFLRVLRTWSAHSRSRAGQILTDALR